MLAKPDWGGVFAHGFLALTGCVVLVLIIAKVDSVDAFIEDRLGPWLARRQRAKTRLNIKTVIRERIRPGPTMTHTSTSFREYRHNEDGTLDEIVTDAEWIHIEQMSDECWWMGIDRKDGSAIHVNFWTPRSRIRANYNDDNGLEGGEFSSGVSVPESSQVRTRGARKGEPTS